MDGDIPHDAPRPRLCHLRKRPDFTGYGFNLHAEKGKSGQFIGKIDDGSPADLAGLREGDRIIEVNGVNVSNENHQQVVQRIKAVADETKFLVVDKVADEYYRERKIVIRGDLSNVQHLETPHFHGANGTDSKHRPRLCHLKIWSDFTGYGFNLHAEKGKAVQYIGKVDDDSPAEAAGLKEHDRIVEVNGFNVANDSHQDVVKRIKSDPKQVTLLVVDREADDYFREQGIVPSSHMSSVHKIVCPDLKQDYKLHNSEVLFKPRLCHIKAKQDGNGFGFNMQAEKGKPGQYIGKVDAGSPAEEAGLREGDRLIEVNGTNVEKESHKDVVTRIRSTQHETTLLVIEKEGYEYFSERDIVISKALLDARDGHRSAENGKADDHHHAGASGSHKGDDDDSSSDDNVADEIHKIAEKEDAVYAKPEEKKADKSGLTLNVTSASASHSSTSSTSPLDSPKSPVVVGGIEFAGTAEEARRKMSKKRNVKESNMSLKAKYDLFQKL